MYINEIMIEVEEIVRLSELTTVISIDLARAIEKAYMRFYSLIVVVKVRTQTAYMRFYDPKAEKDKLWYHYCLLAAIFDGGRIQGIREERARRKGNNFADKIR